MKKLLTTLAVLTVVATPAFAAQSDRYHRTYRGNAANAYPLCPEARDAAQWQALSQNAKNAFCDHAVGQL